MSHKRSTVPQQYARLNSTGSADGGGVGGYSSSNMRLAGNQTSQNQDPKSQQSAPQQLGGPSGLPLGYQQQTRNQAYYQRSAPQTARLQQPRHHPNAPMQYAGTQSAGQYVNIGPGQPPQYLFNPTAISNIVVRIPNQTGQQYPHPQVPINYGQQQIFYQGFDYPRAYVSGSVQQNSNPSHVPTQTAPQHPPIVAGSGNGPNGMGSMQGLPIPPPVVGGSMMPGLPAMQHIGTVGPGLGANIPGQTHMQGHPLSVPVPSGAPPPGNQKKVKQRLRAIKIMDPNTGDDVVERMNQETSAQSTDSSTSHTPQSQVSSDSDAFRVQSEFAGKVAALVSDENGNNNVSISSNIRVAEPSVALPPSTVQPKTSFHPQQQLNQQLSHMKEQRESPPLPAAPDLPPAIAPPSPPPSPVVPSPVTASLSASQPPPPSSSVSFHSQTPQQPPVEEKVNGPTTVSSLNEIQETEVFKPKVEPPQPLQLSRPPREIPIVSASGLLSPAATTVAKQPHLSSISHPTQQHTPPSSTTAHPPATATSAAPPQRKPQSSGPADSKSTKQEKKLQPKESRGPFPPPASIRPTPGSTPPPIGKFVIGPPPGLASSSSVPPQSTLQGPSFTDLIKISNNYPPMPQPQPQQAPIPSSAVTVEETNGETDNHESTTAQVGKPSQKKGKKKKDLNMKGKEKEGTEMDAFTDSTEVSTMGSETTAAGPVQHIKQSSAPPSSSSALTATDVVTNVRVASPTLPQQLTPISATVPETKVEVISKTEETQNTAEESLPSTINNNIDAETVPAENDEYAKVNATGVESNNNLSNEINNSSSSPISDSNNNGREENGEVNDETEDSERSSSALASEKSFPKPPPRLSYQEGQWSPSNPEGKKVYPRSFLMEVKLLEIASRKPILLPDLEILKDKPSDAPMNNRRNIQSSSMSGRNDNFNYRGSPSQRGSMMNMKGNRGIQQMNRMGGSMGGHMGGGPRGMGGKGPGHQFNSISLNSYQQPREEQLHTVDNRWVPVCMGTDMSKSKEELKTEVLLKKVRGILNKLTPQKFDVLLKQFMELPIDSQDRLRQTVTLVFSKAVDEPSFAVEYASLCCALQTRNTDFDAKSKAAATEGGDPAKQPMSFRQILLTQCQDEFERNKKEELNIEARNKEIEACTDPEKKKEMKLIFEDEERRMRRKSVGLVRFIGELYKLRMLTSKIMHNCVQSLLDKIDEESLECLCKLLTTVGKMLEESEFKVENVKKRGIVLFNEYFAQMKKLTDKSPDSKVSSRIRFMLQDVIELRDRQWVPRRDENAPKTLDQIQKDAEREREMIDRQMFMTPTNSSMNNQGMKGRQMGDDRRQGRPKNDNDWTTIPSKNRNFSINVDSTKLSGFKSDISNMQLGKMDAYGKWSSGAGAGATAKPVSGSAFGSTNLPLPRTANKYDPLSSQNSLSGRKIGPSASMEKERALSGVKEMMGNERRLVGSSSMSSRPGSGPPSRESSRARYGEPGSSPAGSMGGDRSYAPSLASPAAPPMSTMMNYSSMSSTAPSLKGAPQFSSSGANTPSSSGSPIPVTTLIAPMSEEECDRMSKTILEEWTQNLATEKETIDALKERFGTNTAPFVRFSLNEVIEKPNKHVPFGKLLVIMVREAVISPEEIVNEYSTTLMDIAYDLIVDIPHLWKYFCNLIAPVIAGDAFTFAHVSQMCQQIKKEDLSKLLVLIVNALLNEKTTKWIRTKWDSSGVKVEDFLPEGTDVHAFLKEKRMEFLVEEIPDGGDSSETGGAGGKTSSSESTESSKLTPEKIEEKLVSLLQSDVKNSFDLATNWIKVNLSDETISTMKLDFIKSLTRGVLKASASIEQLSPKFASYSKLLRFYIDNDEACELACLKAITRLIVVELSASSNVIKELFRQLLETGVISKNGFVRWQEESETEEGSGVMMKALTAFFVELSEDVGEESSDES